MIDLGPNTQSVSYLRLYCTYTFSLSVFGQEKIMASEQPWEQLIPENNPFLPDRKPKKPSSNSGGHNDDESSQDGEGGEEMPEWVLGVNM